MTSKRFKAGQEVVCTDGQWDPTEHSGSGRQVTRDPKNNEIVVVQDYSHFDKGWFIHIEGFDPTMSYEESAFEPVVDISFLLAEVEALSELV